MKKSETTNPVREALLVASEKKTIKEAAASLGWSVSKFYNHMRKDEEIWNRYCNRQGKKTRCGKRPLSYAEHQQLDRERTRKQSEDRRGLHFEGHHCSKDETLTAEQEIQKIRKASHLAEKALAARAAGLTYGYYVALVLDKTAYLQIAE